jgi:hypothetical protein
LKSRLSRQEGRRSASLIFQDKMASKTSDFMNFKYNIVGAFVEYLNDVQQHSYDKLTTEWWSQLHNEIQHHLSSRKTKYIQRIIFNRVLSRFPEDFLTIRQKNELLMILNEAVGNYLDTRYPY